MKLTISDNLQKELPDFSIISYSMDVCLPCAMDKTKEVSAFIEQVETSLKDSVLKTQICSDYKLIETRNAYKILGKDPSHTRPACEALFRRVNDGKKLYRLGDVIDLGNVLSLLCKRSVCVVDYDKISGNILITKGIKDELYYGIGRGLINVENIPVYKDDISSFGSVTSDTERTMITSTTKKILVMILCFSKNDLSVDELKLKEVFTKYHTCMNLIKIQQD